MKDAKMITTVIPAKHPKTNKPWDRKRNTDDINKKFWEVANKPHCPECGSALEEKTNTQIGLYYSCPNCDGSYIETDGKLEEIVVER